MNRRSTTGRAGRRRPSQRGPDHKSQFDDHEWIAVDRSRALRPAVLLLGGFCNTCAGNGNVKLYVPTPTTKGVVYPRRGDCGNGLNVQGAGDWKMAVSSTGIVEALARTCRFEREVPDDTGRRGSTDGGGPLRRSDPNLDRGRLPVTGALRRR